MLNIGKLHQIKKLYWFLYPSKDIATDAYASPSLAAAVATSAEASGHGGATYFSKQFNCNVTFVSPNDIFCLLEQDGKYLKILSTNGELGWMIYPTNEPWTKGCIEEVKQ
jgi:hypothetical protein